MTPDEVAALISYIGVLLQLIGSLLLAGLFWMLHRYARRGTYFTLWGWAWASLSVALALLVVRLGMVEPMAPHLGEQSGIVQLLYGGYQAAKLLFLALLVSGVVLYARGLRLRLPALVGRVAAPAAAYAFVTALLSPGLDAVVAFQAPLVIGALAYCAGTLLRLPPSRSSFASRRTGVLFATIAGLWVLYSIGFLLAALKQPLPYPLQLLLSYNSYVDLLLQVALGYGMVVVLMEDSKREVDDARKRLTVVHDRLKHDSYVDVLTGALNRRAFTEGVGLHLARAKFGSVVMLDLDDLKEVNDRQGHAAGDAMLRRLVEALHVRLRVSDALYRWGGDEFLAVLPGATPDQALAVIGSALDLADPDASGVAAGVLRASAGAAVYSGGEDLAAALERADREMYRNKSERKQPAAARRAPEPGLPGLPIGIGAA